MFFGLNHLYKKKINRERKLQGIALLKKLSPLLAAIQQHRGLTMGDLHGEAGLLKRIKPLEQTIDQQILVLNLEQGWLASNLTWQGINDHWLRISSNYKTYESDYNFRQHCTLITNILRLIEECAENYHLHENIYTNKDNTNLLWSQLLISAEHIGQARAIGTSIAKEKEYNNIQAIRLNSLKDSIHEFSVLQHSEIIELKELLNAISDNVLISSPNISAEEFFNLATLALEFLLNEFDDHLNDVKRSL